MAGKLSCLQLFPPFIYLFFFTVLNITSLSLLLEAKRFQCVGLHFRLFKEPSWRKDFIPQPARLQEGVFWMRRRVFLPLRHIYGAVPTASSSSPGITRVAGCRQSHTGTVWMLLWTPHWAGAWLYRCSAAVLPFPSVQPWQLLEKFLAGRCLGHLGSPQRDWLRSCIPFPCWWGRDGHATRCSLVRQQWAGPLGPSFVPSRLWQTLTAIKLKSNLLSAEATEYGVISVLA